MASRVVWLSQVCLGFSDVRGLDFMVRRVGFEDFP